MAFLVVGKIIVASDRDPVEPGGKRWKGQPK
jgi:hypothetical protein